MFKIYYDYWYYNIWVVLAAPIRISKMAVRNFKIKISMESLLYLGFCVAHNHSLDMVSTESIYIGLASLVMV